MILAEWWLANSLFPSAFISWYPVVRKSFLFLPVYSFICSFIYIIIGLWICTHSMSYLPSFFISLFLSLSLSHTHTPQTLGEGHGEQRIKHHGEFEHLTSGWSLAGRRMGKTGALKPAKRLCDRVRCLSRPQQRGLNISFLDKQINTSFLTSSMRAH